MSQEHLAALRALYEQFARGDFSAYREISDDFELTLAPEMPDAGTYRGDAARRWLATWVDSFEELTIDATGFREAGDHVVVEMVQRGRPTGANAVVELRNWGVSTARDGVPFRWALFLTREEALRAAGLPS